MMRAASSSKFRRIVVSLFALRATDPDQRSRELILRVLYMCTLSISVSAFFAVSVNYLVLNMYYLAPRVIIVGCVTLFIASLYAMILKQRFAIPSYALLAFYFVGATATVWTWGVETPIATLLFALVVIFAGILLSARYSLYATGIIIAFLAIYIRLTEARVAHPDTSWAATPTRMYDLITVGVILGNIALISWLFNRSMQQSLARAQRSEQALLRQKKMLEIKVEERTRQVQAANLEHMQELYRFAELGHLGVGLLHDLSNYLMVLSLDIEDLKQEHKNRSAVIRRVQQGMKRLDNLVAHTRNQINGEVIATTFNIVDEIDQAITILVAKSDKKRVHITWQNQPDRKNLQYTGSVNQFWQIITNVISNAIDAYDGIDSKQYPKRDVLISVRQEPASIVIQVTDFGVGIASSKITKIFEPFYSTKQQSTGVGLAIVKQMIEKNFGGTISAASTSDGTTFTIRLAPRQTE
jgi:signal transduction histidine kinase